MKKKLTSVLLFLALSAGVVSAQTSKVTGKVIGEDGEPVIGASIIVKGTTVGTVTDFDGNFELEVPANGKQLVISYIGRGYGYGYLKGKESFRLCGSRCESG